MIKMLTLWGQIVADDQDAQVPLRLSESCLVCESGRRISSGGLTRLLWGRLAL